MSLSPTRSGAVLAQHFARRSRGPTMLLSVTVGAVLALALCFVFGLISFIGHVGDRGQMRGFGPFTEGGCVQAQNRFDPLDLTQYTNYLVASTCDHPAVPPGLSSFPQPGEVYVSPQLGALRDSDARIATRFPRVDGAISNDGLASADELFSITGVPAVTGALPLGVTSFDRFGSTADYVANFLRFNQATLLVIGLFFTMLPAAFLVAACTRLNARTRERQLGLLSVLGVGPVAVRRALSWEAVLTVGAGAIVGALVAPVLLARLTPEFVGWRAFPGDFSVSPLVLPLVVLLVVATAAAAAAVGARAVDRGPSRRASTRRAPGGSWRWAVLGAGVAAGLVTVWFNSDAAWPVVLGGRVATFIGLILVSAPLCARIGSCLTSSDSPFLALAGARLRRPAGSLTRALGALVSGLFVLSAGTATVSSLGDDPAGIQQAYSPDGLSVVEVRRPGGAVRSIVDSYDGLTGTNMSTTPGVAGSLSGSCEALGNVIGREASCGAGTVFASTYSGQVVPAGVDAVAVPVTGPRASAVSGFLLEITSESAPGPDDDVSLVALPTDEAEQLLDRLVGVDPSANVRIFGAAVVSGASELDAILDVFRWGAIFAVVLSLLAALVSLVALLYDRQAANNYLQILGVSRGRAAVTTLAEVLAASGATVVLALGCSWVWSLAISSSGEPLDLVSLAVPFAAVLVALVGAAAVVVWLTLRGAGVSVVPDRDGLVSAHDVFRPEAPARAPASPATRR